ncbi:MAG: hypothetical protein P8129_11775 [Anaerolineae bacterium]
MKPHARVLTWVSLVCILLSAGCSADCEWVGSGQAWVDENADGMHDPGEPPLAGVTLHASDVRNGVWNSGGPSVTNWKGEATLWTFLPGCPRVKMEVRADVPEGYRLTTPARLADQGGREEQVYEFGFAYLPGVPTVTPLPPAPVCTTQSLGDAEEMHVTGLATAGDGTLWVSTSDGVKSYHPDRGWQSYTQADGLVDDRVRSVTAGGDGAIWFATDGGASRFDGQTWTSYTVADGLINSTVFNVSLAPDGSIWFGTFNGISQFWPSTGQWTTYMAQSGVKQKDAIEVAAMPDGSVWYLTTISAAYRAGPPEQEGERRRWVMAPNTDTFSDWEDVAVGPDGGYWFVGLDSVGRFDPGTERWILYDEGSTGGVYRGWGQALDVAPDGAIWIAAGNRSITIYRLMPDLQATGAVDWQVYDQGDLFPGHRADEEGDAALNIAVGPDGTVWFATYDSVTRCTFSP